MKTSSRLFLALLLLAGACDTPVSTRPEAAYNPTALTNGLYYHWPNGSVVTVWVQQAGLASSIDLTGAVTRARAAWNTVPQYDEYRMLAAASAADANIIVYDASTPIPIVPVADCAFDARGAGGYTYFCDATMAAGAAGNAARLPLVAGGGRATVVIRLDRGRATSDAQYDALVAHEFGHALGIGAHSDNSADLMFGNPAVLTPSARDQATLRFDLGKVPDLRL
ncbi:MAG: hypothetical protein M3Y64_03735 [Gemmatimonadota bacterium]|nr:hypothetical protein [Gemmatimonadota bacterium]